jgi:hypothetical protein
MIDDELLLDGSINDHDGEDDPFHIEARACELLYPPGHIVSDANRSTAHQLRDRAIQLFEQLVSQSPRDVRAMVTLGSIRRSRSPGYIRDQHCGILSLYYCSLPRNDIL